MVFRHVFVFRTTSSILSANFPNFQLELVGKQGLVVFHHLQWYLRIICKVNTLLRESDVAKVILRKYSTFVEWDDINKFTLPSWWGSNVLPLHRLVLIKGEILLLMTTRDCTDWKEVNNVTRCMLSYNDPSPRTSPICAYFLGTFSFRFIHVYTKFLLSLIIRISWMCVDR